ncbi:MAG: adenine-specific methyltransferase EcoRI family protein [Saprospiraceae bacterium]|nr:adenine-specific methyltransferase EcoRI family protein [Saprospiraceae bacterium]
MARNATNKLLHKAKKSKSDEFYTQYSDIQKEVEAYLEFDPDVFRNKVVYCNCDDPFESNFFRYFVLNFKRIGLKQLITTSYKPSPVANTQLELFGDDKTLTKEKGRPKITANKFIINEVGDIDGDGEFSLKDVALQLKENRHNEWEPLNEDGDFRSKESISLLKKSDIVITNPPFSLFKDYISQLIEHDKKFLIIANINAITYKEVFPLIKENKIWLGTGMGRWISGFIVPESYELYGTEARIDEDGKRIVATNNCLWLTNLDHGRRHQPLPLMTMKDNIKFSSHKEIKGKEYRKYDNYDAIEVPYSDAIPSDYTGVMGVPITFLDKYNPAQFEIIGASDNGVVDEKYKIPHFKKHNEPYVDGQKTYKRIFIKKR